MRRISPRKWRQRRRTFRHGNLPEALIDAALARLEVGGMESLSLRELARDAGVNHRAVYRHFPDKLSLLARVAEEGWQRLEKRVLREKSGKKQAGPAIIASASGFFKFAREYPNLFHLMAGPRINTEGAFPDLDKAIASALHIFMRDFVETGIALKFARERTAIFIAALTGVIEQMLYKRLRVAPAKSLSFIANTSKMLVKGLR